MNPTLKNILAVVAGLIMGSIVNMSIIMMSSAIIPPPEGADVTTMEGLKATMHLFEPKHFLMPFLAHALGTLVGAFVAGLIAVNTKKMAMVIGIIFLIGGSITAYQLSSPLWFVLVDLILAYLPMAYMGGRFAMGKGR